MMKEFEKIEELTPGDWEVSPGVYSLIQYKMNGIYHELAKFKFVTITTVVAVIMWLIGHSVVLVILLSKK